jgi:hypothetical protein
MLDLVRNVTYTGDVETTDGAGVADIYGEDNAVAKSGTLSFALMTQYSGTTKVNNLDVSVFSVGGIDYIGNLEGGELAIEWAHAEGKAINDKWRYPVRDSKTIEASGQLRIPAAAGVMLSTRFHDEAYAQLDVNFSVTINGVAYAFPGLLKQLGVAIGETGPQMMPVQITGKGAPTAPGGTATLLAHMLNGSAALPVVLTTKAAGGQTISGNFLPRSARVSFAGESLVMVQYEFASQGVVTAVATV